MGFSSREQIINKLKEQLEAYIQKYDLDDIGIFEEQGKDEEYFVGYTIKKNGKTYHLHTPYKKSDDNELVPTNKEWIIETDDPQGEDLRGYHDIENALSEL
ncbi:DUF5634 family protein [Bacillus massilinigeriensis]|uniref:DUF5634 family protein n=1 Tax=Bacillus massilionigeriensis TaxID=1805475 RepID=UPI00096B1683|nr:DUF5634 family protein [Bacillus massilionigeriensis]